jgi:hypothetical protein
MDREKVIKEFEKELKKYVSDKDAVYCAPKLLDIFVEAKNELRKNDK